MKTLGLALACTVLGASAAEKPNFVWIISEDNSIHYLDHFSPGGAKVPNIESMAKHGVTFDNAFSNAPVCWTTPSCSTLATTAACCRVAKGTPSKAGYTCRW